MKNDQTIAEFLNVKEFPFKIKDKNGNIIYCEDYNKYWEKKEFDQNGNVINYKISFGSLSLISPKEFTMDEIAKKFNIPVENLKIKK